VAKIGYYFGKNLLLGNFPVTGNHKKATGKPESTFNRVVVTFGGPPMETYSGLVTIGIFLLGASVGALVITIQRIATMDRIRRRFQEELEQNLSQEIAQRWQP
jgi:hypothetical protein